jgi:hypothetical protein
MTIENKHFETIEQELLPFAWASHIILAPLTGGIPTTEQQIDFTNWVTRSSSTDVRTVKTRFDTDIDHWGLSFLLDAEDESDALHKTAAIALDGLAYAGVNIEHLEHVGNHLAYFDQLRADVDQATQAGQIIDITSQRYYVLDEDLAHDAFLQARQFYAELDTLLK